ncbi:uncharacterized protein LOC111470466 [Cucurbita maxima]|uniref:Uncharacterized protein LOC111470466 n=1 Tax=Cucurbita maxima TaxID=3661 RepID=A0A6J1I7Z7_CUCMA|nr:uncharacterized protein LOC111470466 [Cucurbita maxima]
MWAVCMETYMEVLDLLEAIEENYEVPSLSENPTVAQIKVQKEKKTRKSKAKACLFATVSQMIFMRIMSLKKEKEIWDYLSAEYEGDERIGGMKVLNLIRDFELQKMKDSESVKEYSNRLLSIANKVRLLGSVLNDSSIVEKLLVTVSEKLKPPSLLWRTPKTSQEHRSMRQEGVIEGALPVKHQNNKYKKKKNFKNQSMNGDSSANYQKTKGGGSEKTLSTCRHCVKKGHPLYKCWRRPDAKCSKCNQLGHEAVICKVKGQMKEVDAQKENDDKKVEADIFVGYNIISKAYRVFQPHTSRVIMSRDVHFAGNEQWNWEELTKVKQISNALNNLIFGSMLEESEDERQDTLVDDAPIRGGVFGDRENKT